MYYNGFLKVSAQTPNLIMGNPQHNATETLKIINKSRAAVIVFPELSLTGYSLGDLFYQTSLIEETLESLRMIINNNKHQGLVVVGMPLDVFGVLYNVAVAIQGNKILGVIPKQYLPNHHEFYEKRWFKSGMYSEIKQVVLLGQVVPFGHILLIEENKKIQIGIEICQDLWANESPSDDLANAGANVILNLSASTEYIGKASLRRHTILDHSRKQMGAYIYTTTGSLESTSESVFSNHKVIAVQGKLIKESALLSHVENEIIADIHITHINYQRRHDSNYRDHLNPRFEYQKVYFNLPEIRNYQFEDPIHLRPFVGDEEDMTLAFEILVTALTRKVQSLPENLRKLIVGVSGGLDSTLALIVAHEAFKRANWPLDNIIGVTMPTAQTSSRTYQQAIKLMDALSIQKRDIGIQDQVDLHLKSLDHAKKDVTFENAQARVRTLILMNIANQAGGIVLGTGDLSEIALGWMTYNGDQMSMYAINSGIPKTVIPYILKSYSKENPNMSDVINQVIETPISPELLDNQSTEAAIGRYDINDFIMYHYLVSGMNEAALKWLVKTAFMITSEEALLYVTRFLKRFYQSQFKRQTLPEGPKVLQLSLSPRGEYRQPSDISRK